MRGISLNAFLLALARRAGSSYINHRHFALSPPLLHHGSIGQHINVLINVNKETRIKPIEKAENHLAAASCAGGVVPDKRAY